MLLLKNQYGSLTSFANINITLHFYGSTLWVMHQCGSYISFASMMHGSFAIDVWALPKLRVYQCGFGTRNNFDEVFVVRKRFGLKKETTCYRSQNCGITHWLSLLG